MAEKRKNWMTEKEKSLFRKNYNYMWNKLNTSHYYVKGNSNTAQAIDTHNRIKGEDLLPSYVICYKCTLEEYEPTQQTVRKIVMFYNQNIEPEVSAWQFLNEELSKTDAIRHLSRTRPDDRFIGTFYGYYFSSSISVEPIGAILKIYKTGKKENSILRASLITGIRTDEDLHSDNLKKLFANEPITKKQYDEYFYGLPQEKRRCYYYEGVVEITDNSVLILFHGCDSEPRKLVLTLNISKFPRPTKKEEMERPYVGGLAFMLLTCDSPFDTRFFQMGLINSNFNVIPLTDPQLNNLLTLRTSGKDVLLTVDSDRIWYELAIQSFDKHL